MTTTLRRVCVFCGSNAGASTVYADGARALARALARRRIGLVYGAGSVGMMGILADTMLAVGGEATGVIPRALWDREVGHAGLTDLRVVGTMHERKALMAELSDAFIALPGGLGTLEEFFEIWTWAQLGIHAKPCGVLDIAGYYDPLLAFIDHAVQEQFLRDAHRAMIIVDDEPERLLDRLQQWRPPHVAKWLDRAQS